ncbi:MAG: haloacid dehalogenase-like hydrolase [Acidimicrobiia bacterium]
MSEQLPSWRPGRARDDVLRFLDAVRDVPVAERFACFDNDGTLWCERPTYVQFDFFVDALRQAVAVDPEIGARPEFEAVLRRDSAALASMGLERIAMALAGLFEGMTPDEFTLKAREFVERARHVELDRAIGSLVYQPMLELLEELRRLDFTVAIVTGGGTEFVRAVSEELYGVPSELVVGSLIAYEFGRDDGGVPELRRTSRLMGVANEGAAKVENIQTQLGRRPILAGGNSGGDREMLEWAVGGDKPGVAILIDHDDPEREYSYESRAQTFEEDRPITEVARELGWTVVSMIGDWATVFK